MKSGGLFILGGLLQGVGKGLVEDADAKRVAALEALKRSQTVDDRDAKIAGDQAVAKINAAGDVERVKATGAENRETEKTKGVEDRLTEAAKGAETRKTETVKFDTDVKMEKLKSELRATEDTHSQELANRLGQADVQSVQTADDGEMIVVKKDGTFEKTGVTLHLKSEDDDLSITGAQSSRGGKPGSAPKSKANDAVRRQALATLGTVYAKISSDPAKVEQYRSQYPGMFDANGNLLPRQDLIDRVNQRYGN